MMGGGGGSAPDNRCSQPTKLRNQCDRRNEEKKQTPKEREQDDNKKERNRVIFGFGLTISRAFLHPKRIVIIKKHQVRFIISEATLYDEVIVLPGGEEEVEASKMG